MSGEACSAGCGYCGRCSGGPRCNATCPDCGEPCWIGRDDTGSLCDACCDRRDAHSSALELRLMVAAVLRADLTKVRDVA